MGGSLTGKAPSQTSAIPAGILTALNRGNILAGKVGQQGYVPYQGADVAAFTPQQLSGMQETSNWDQVFNDPGGPQAPLSIMPTERFGNGMTGYSSYGGYQDQLKNLQDRYPGLAKYIQSFAVNPKTGADARAFHNILNRKKGSF